MSVDVPNIPDTVLRPALDGLLPFAPEHQFSPTPATLLSVAGSDLFFAGDPGELARVARPAGHPADWTPLLGHIDAVIWRAAAARTSDQHRRALLALLRAWAGQRLARPGTWRTGTRYPLERDPRILNVAGKRYLHNAAIAVPAEAREVRSVVVTRDDSARLLRFADLLDEFGPLTVSDRAITVFSTRTGVRHAVARLVLEAFPYFEVMSPSAKKALRAAPYGMTERAVGEFGRLGDRLQSAGRLTLLAGGVPDDPAELWAEDADIAAAERVAIVWNDLVGHRTPVPEETAVALEKATGLPETVAVALLEPTTSTLTTEIVTHDLRYEWDRVSATARGSGEVLYGRRNLYRGLATALAWALTERPVGETLAARAAETYAALRARLSTPDLLAALGLLRVDAAVFGPRTHPRFTSDRPVHDNGLLVVDASQNYQYPYLRTAGLADTALVEHTVRLCGEHGMDALAHAVRCEHVLVDGLARVVDRADATPVASGGYEADPRRSAPDLVEQVGATLGIASDAATLYLQLLTLARPTDRNIRLWNGWKSARHKDAETDLLLRRLVEPGRRPRAGRSVFLPGDWTHKVDTAHLPLETAKLARYRATVRDKEIIGPYLRLLPPIPLHEMFAEAWESAS
ncbi:hypothetical protein ACTD5D_14725 [Nocardia takedensis]|uniref:hypothetical protein n=1 Tax=Nocardia takedensis TaxID=259390 RepID=UPI0003004214|nr:hypothetical protein [Nocardia takedensis]